MTLPCVLVIREGFMEVVWKEADSSAPVCLVAMGIVPSCELSVLLCNWNSTGTWHPVGGEPAGAWHFVDAQ